MRLLCCVLWLCVAAAAAQAELSVALLGPEGAAVVRDGDLPVLRYNHGKTAPPDGVDAVYTRGGYVHPLYGARGTVLTEDYPHDHPHHRGINWSWATIAWQGKTLDQFAVQGVHTEPAGELRPVREGEAAGLSAPNIWRWDDGTVVMHEDVTILVHPGDGDGRLIDFTIRLTPAVAGLSIGGRIPRGYSGFNLRMAPGTEQESWLQPGGGRAWGDYSAVFEGSDLREGVAVLEHKDNPDYPNEWRQYPTLNFFQPAWPGGRMVDAPEGAPIVLRYRLWVHEGRATAEQLDAMRTEYDAEEATTP